MKTTDEIMQGLAMRLIRGENIASVAASMTNEQLNLVLGKIEDSRMPRLMRRRVRKRITKYIKHEENDRK